MEKKTLILPIMILLVLILTSCSGTSGGPIEPNDENMIISFENNANFDFYGIKVEILNQAPTSVNADGSKIEKGDSHIFEITGDSINTAEIKRVDRD